ARTIIPSTIHSGSIISMLQSSPKSESIAIVGMGRRFPGGAHCAASLWSRLLEGMDAIGEGPRDRWHVERFWHPDAGQPGKTYDAAPVFWISLRMSSMLDSLVSPVVTQLCSTRSSDYCSRLHGRLSKMRGRTVTRWEGNGSS